MQKELEINLPEVINDAVPPTASLILNFALRTAAFV